ncbi:hypothetical protein OKA05_09315 [Luteolibacter arcticus]|uniref:Uncharacterized protein n=1 Tax=Luteolibacter arcticus TaxID=1581411 RepID=A0ABT3GGK7_9BACT|nr:hypothetical protein [Luteolibacter arcticus]MCW1922750.1 hypothetical protein [Luteolibacter arcticus]
MNTTVRQLCCQGCGASLPVTEGIRFLTCNYCNARLEVVQDQATTHTRLLEGIEQRTKKIERDVEAIRIQGELKHLDEAWAKYEARVDPRDQHGRRTEPAGGIIVIGLIGVVVGIALLFSEVWWLGVFLAPAAAWFMVKAFRWEMNRARIFQGMRLQYEMRRKMLIQQKNGGR